jgi:lipopolysaccharide transport system ATP-binding protein
VGEIGIKGRIAALLEVGTGFHPELTGRENVFLNGAILGMTKAEIKSKLEEIVDFSGVEKYLDTPVKRYSSGMVVRLGFAVAAHLEPEILIVDEVLAVGDADFQKKCIGKMRDVNDEGRTVLFVSHNMASVKTFCKRGIVLNNGGIIYEGNIDESVNYYLKDGNSDGLTEYRTFKGDANSNVAEAELLSVGIRAKGRQYGDFIRMDDAVEIVARFNKKTTDCKLDATIQVKDTNGNYLFSSGSVLSPLDSNKAETGIFEYIVNIPDNFFNADTFYLNLLIVKDERETLIRFNDVLFFNILDKEHKIGAWIGKGVAPLRPNFKWEAVHQ